MLLASEMKIPGRRGPGDLAQFGDEGVAELLGKMTTNQRS